VALGLGLASVAVLPARSPVGFTPTKTTPATSTKASPPTMSMLRLRLFERDEPTGSSGPIPVPAGDSDMINPLTQRHNAQDCSPALIPVPPSFEPEATIEKRKTEVINR
jgi:hypothetical protein